MNVVIPESEWASDATLWSNVALHYHHYHQYIILQHVMWGKRCDLEKGSQAIFLQFVEYLSKYWRFTDTQEWKLGSTLIVVDDKSFPLYTCRLISPVQQALVIWEGKQLYLLFRSSASDKPAERKRDGHLQKISWSMKQLLFQTRDVMFISMSSLNSDVCVVYLQTFTNSIQAKNISCLFQN